MTENLSNSVLGRFTQKEGVSNEVKALIMQAIQQNSDLSKYDQYHAYRFAEPQNAHSFFCKKIETLLSASDGDWIFFYEIATCQPCLVGVRESKWDESHFGFKMANIQILLSPNSLYEKEVLARTLLRADEYLKNQGVKFISARINGDHLVAIHCMEDSGFRYYDDVVWPIVSTNKFENIGGVRLMNPGEEAQVKYIAENFQYRRGHYYCDERFEKNAIDSMYAKWVKTTINNNECIAVIERENKIAGLFVFKLDRDLQQQTGYLYGRLRLLALDSQFRGMGAGEELFTGTLALIKSMGADYIDSGYSTKNHISARLHTKVSFMSVYEEVTLHKWIN